MPTTIQLPGLPEKAPFVDPKTGTVSRDWLIYLKAMDKIIRELAS